MTPPPGKKDSLSDNPAPYLDMNPVLNALPEVNEKTCESYIWFRIDYLNQMYFINRCRRLRRNEK